MAVLGNIVASSVQKRFDLIEDPVRFVLVGIPFVACIGLLLFVTLKRFRTQACQQNSNSSQQAVRVQQHVQRVAAKGKVTGVEAEELTHSATINVKQKANKVEGKITGAKIDKL